MDTSCVPTEGDPFVTDQDKPSFSNRTPPRDHMSHMNDFMPFPETYQSYAPPHCISQPEGSIAPPPPDSDDALLAFFQNEMMPAFPFVIVPHGVSADALTAARPFLMSAIRMVASFRSMKSIRGQMFQIMSYIGDHMLVRSERSLDLLMGIVIILGWFHYHCIMHTQMNNLLCLANSLVADLGLNWKPILLDKTRILLTDPEPQRERTNEERRLVLAVWYLSST